MSTLTIPTPFRPYADSVSSLEIQSEFVGGAINELVTQFPALRQHLYDENGKIQPYINLFINGEDVRYLQGVDTPLLATDKLRIVPSIAGGKRIRTDLKKVDHAALRTNQTFIIALSIAAFVVNAPWIAAFVAILMFYGTLRSFPAFGFVYKHVLKPRGWLKADILSDNPEPHRFSQCFGTVVLALGTGLLWAGQSALGWGLVWLVVFLAGLNLFGGFCVGCALYYWLNRLSIPGFDKAPPSGIFPGKRPQLESIDG